MWTRKLDHAVFVVEERYDWVEARNKPLSKFVAIASLALIAGTIVSAAL